MFNLNVTVNLGDPTIALLTQFAPSATKAAMPTALAALAPEAVEESAPVKVEVKPEAATRVRRTKAEIEAAKAEEAADGWAALDDEGKLEAIKTEITKHAKKGKAADIKFLLSAFDAARAGELLPEHYDAFFDAITRYGNGEALESIVPEDLA